MLIILYSIPFFILAMIVEIVYARAKKRPYYRWNDTLSNLGAGIFQQALTFIPAALVIAAYPIVHERWGASLFKGKADPVTFILCLLLVDFLYYWAHRMFHRTGLGWTGHIVHHQSEEYNLSVALRQSWLQGFHGLPFLIIPALLGFDLEVSLTCSAINTVYQFWIHTKAIDKCPRWFEAVFNTPSHHRVHHGRNPQYIDKNYAGSLIIWDKLFGTFEPENEPVVYGITQATQSWNPLKAQFGPWGELFKKGRGKGLALNLKYNIYPPGWNEIDGDQLPPLIPRNKYDPTVSRSRQLLASGSFVLALLLLLAFMIKRPELSALVQVFFVVAITGLLYLSGFWMEANSKGEKF
jgi:sterol desaturase/sphingolipid hydroxylase (fatty acid hydroxylase superfamily)